MACMHHTSHVILFAAARSAVVYACTGTCFAVSWSNLLSVETTLVEVHSSNMQVSISVFRINYYVNLLASFTKHIQIVTYQIQHYTYFCLSSHLPCNVHTVPVSKRNRSAATRIDFASAIARRGKLH